ncbi:testis-specific serine/threonine-protein kinase 1-like [Tachypleus tridentatus]|uniref:testis-specific serine/threonine-protein kinase 1-like n=1 Tax=Tachypleus tridentatus TaxID=6853 RepID=UPI003FCFCD41
MQIAHRDLKCENILLTQDDNVKLTDFGFSRRCVDPTTGRRVLSETYCGSAAYAAPEVLQGTPYNPKMYDAWSLGCILFIMITGTMPFDDSNVKKMIQVKLQRRIKIPSGVTCTTRCEELIRHILEPDVTRRATVNQVLRLLVTRC